jgi:hypothetical protein
VGIDFSRSAIEKAKARNGKVHGKLEFQTVDICRESPAAGPVPSAHRSRMFAWHSEL